MEIDYKKLYEEQQEYIKKLEEAAEFYEGAWRRAEDLLDYDRMRRSRLKPLKYLCEVEPLYHELIAAGLIKCSFDDFKKTTEQRFVPIRWYGTSYKLAFLAKFVAGSAALLAICEVFEIYEKVDGDVYQRVHLKPRSLNSMLNKKPDKSPLYDIEQKLLK